MKIAFPEKLIKAIYKRGKNLNKVLSPSSFPSTKTSSCWFCSMLNQLLLSKKDFAYIKVI